MIGITRRTINRLVTQGFQIPDNPALISAFDQEIHIFGSPQIPVRLQSKSADQSVVDSRSLEETYQSLEYRLNVQGKSNIRKKKLEVNPFSKITFSPQSGTQGDFLSLSTTFSRSSGGVTIEIIIKKGRAMIDPAREVASLARGVPTAGRSDLDAEAVPVRHCEARDLRISVRRREGPARQVLTDRK